MLLQRERHVLADRQRVEERPLLEDVAHPPAQLHQRVLAQVRDGPTQHLDLAAVGPQQTVDVLEEDGLPFARAAEDDDGLAGRDLEADAVEDLVRSERLADPSDRERAGRSVAHSARNSFVRKKSSTRTVIATPTTVSVVALPTPSAPPRAHSPLYDAISPIANAKNTDLPSPEKTSP